MGFGLGAVLYSLLLLTNAIAILNEERFLSRVGWTKHSQVASFTDPVYGNGGFAPEGPSVKQRAIEWMSSVRTVMRIPLVAVNIVVIVYELVLG